MTHPNDAAPVNPLPPIVIALFLGVVVPEVAFSLGAQGILGGPEAIGWRLAAVERYAFAPDIFLWMAQNGRWLPEHVMRFATYPFVHVAFTATLFSAVMLLALGKMVGEVLGQVAVAVIYFGSAIFAALVYGALPGDPGWLIGGFPPVYGLIGGYTFVIWMRLGATGGQQLRAFRLIALLMGLQLLWGALFGPNIEWVADLAGFVFGFAASFVLVPGAIARLLAGFRRD